LLLLTWLSTGGGDGMFRKLIKLLTCEVREARIECVVPSYTITAWRSNNTHAHLLNIICQIHLLRVSVWMHLKTANYGT